MKTLTMMMGEFEHDPLFYGVPNVLLFPISTYFVWIIFIIVMSVLLQNLLVCRYKLSNIASTVFIAESCAQVGLAVDNIKGIRKQAEFKRQVGQVRIMSKLMLSLFCCYCMRFTFHTNNR